MKATRVTLALLLLACVCVGDEVIPHAQDKLPGPALSPAEAMKQMKVPEGFVVELVASEPDLVNPVAMCFDEKGRIWVTESLEYPRNEPGVGRDRIKVLEDTDGDGRADKITVFADGLNIPSGIAVGHGGVWVSNPPDILFMQDTDGDGKADKREVVVTGFGRQDTHEMANSLTWGPDGYLYGSNGVFVRNVIEQNGKKFDFTGAIWRIHPRTREFEIFAEGLSNPWGITFNGDGELFVSACVIDHLWHITQGGQYIRQAGAYPAHAWPIPSIVDHKHQKAAYCGIVWFDSDAYPPEFREKLYMGNIHGNCINADELRPRGSTYRGVALPDLMSSGGDAWFMPVSQKVGPDGNLYILDWYDRYHCYQDARRDPAGIDRLKGRLYRLRYEQNPRKPTLNLAQLADEALIEKLGDPNIYTRETAQRILSERNNDKTRLKLQSVVLNESAPRKQRLHAMWALVSSGLLDQEFHMALLNHSDPTFRAWGVRAAGNFQRVDPALVDRIAKMTDDPSPDVRLQLAAQLPRIQEADYLSALPGILNHSGDDTLIPQVAWENSRQQLGRDGGAAFVRDTLPLLEKNAAADEVLSRAATLLISSNQTPPPVIAELLDHLTDQHRDIAARGLQTLTEQTQSGQLAGPRLDAVRKTMLPVVAKALPKNTFLPLHFSAVVLSATWGDSSQLQLVRLLADDMDMPGDFRRSALRTIIYRQAPYALDTVMGHLLSPLATTDPDYQRTVIASLGRLEDPKMSARLLDVYPNLDPRVQPAVIELLAQRPATAAHLLTAIENKKLPREAVNLNQVRSLAASPDEAVRKKVESLWGRVRTDRNPDREKVIARTQRLAAQSRGDATQGAQVFTRVCAACHAIHGQGQNIGPDLTGNGRSSFDQLLSNVLDPNLVVGEAYQLRTVTMKDGRVLAGMIAEQDEQRVVLKMIGGQSETLPAEQVQNIATLPVSFMPEGLENSMTQQELLDLLAYLSLDKPPTDPQARRIPGAPGPP